MTWDEFKKEWQKLEKSRKTEVIQICLALLASVCIMIWGIVMWVQYAEEQPDSLNNAFVGLLFFCIGHFVFNHFCYITLRDRIERLEDGRE